MNIKKLLMVGLFGASALFLQACGGGDSSSSGTDSGSGANLSLAYDNINQGATLAQVTSIIGYAPNAGVNDYTSEIHYKWSANSGTAQYALLSVQFVGGGVSGKIYVGNGISKSKFY